MDIATARQILNTLFDGIDGYFASAQARNTLPPAEKSFTYGEIVPDSFYAYMAKVVPKKDEVFYDLGSGTGKAVVLASLLFDFRKCVGVEYLADLCRLSKQVKNRFDREMSGNLIKKPALIEFMNADFLECDLAEGDIFFAHSTCFSDQLMQGLVSRIETIRKGSRVITVTKTIESPLFSLVHTGDYVFGWGKASVHCYLKTG